MMTPNELHYLIAAMCLGLSLFSGICTVFNHGWRFPYKWYAAILLYVGATFVVNTPVFDRLCMGPAGLVRDIFNMGLLPLAMLAMCKFVRLERSFTLIMQSTVWVGILGSVVTFYALVPTLLGYVAFAVMAVTVVVWCVAVCRKFLDGGSSGYLRCHSKRWFAYVAVFVAVMSLVACAVRLFFPFLHIERLVLVGEAAVFLPLMLLFQYQRNDQPRYRSESKSGRV